MHPDLSPAQLDARRDLMIWVLSEMKHGRTCIPVFIPPPPPPRSERPRNWMVGNHNNTRTDKEKLETMLHRAEIVFDDLCAETKDQQEFNRLRDRFYTIRSAIKVHCQRTGLQQPEVPLAPISPFPNAHPKVRPPQSPNNQPIER